MKKLYFALCLLLICSCAKSPSKSSSESLAESPSESPAKVENKDFQEYLSLFKEITGPDLNWFQEILTVSDNAMPQKYNKFIPGYLLDSLGQLRLAQGYVKEKDYVTVFLSCYGGACDAYDHYLMENVGQDYFMITYTHEGELIDYKKVGHDGMPHCYSLDLKYDSKHRTLAVEQGALVDGLNLHQYRDFVYNAEKHEYKIGKDGKISSKTVGKPYKKTVVNEKAHGPEITFEQFLSRFTKCDDAELDESVFPESSGDLEDNILPMPSARPYLSDTEDDCGCWETNRFYFPGLYVERAGCVYCFVRRGCDVPPVMDFLVYKYSSKGKCLGADVIFHWGDDGTERDDIRAALTEAVKAKWAEICAGEKK